MKQADRPREVRRERTCCGGSRDRGSGGPSRGLGVCLGVVLAIRSIPRRPAGAGANAQWVDPRNVLVQPSVVPALLAVMLHVGAFFVTVQL